MAYRAGRYNVEDHLSRVTVNNSGGKNTLNQLSHNGALGSDHNWPNNPVSQKGNKERLRKGPLHTRSTGEPTKEMGRRNVSDKTIGMNTYHYVSL
jgi:hypothetical protein